MSRTHTIQAIIDARQPMAKKAAEADKALYQIEGEIRKFKEFIPRFTENLDPEAVAELKALYPAIDQLLTRLSEEKERIGLLAQRFSRRTLNIGVVGPARNGKSTLLQQITGLTPEEIPSGNKGHLTGAPSFIYHRDSDITEGELHFFTESEFLKDVVAPYYRELNWLGSAPSSLDAFRRANLVNEAGNDATKSKIFEKLLETRDALDSFRQYFGQGQKVIPKEEIREWIAQEGVAEPGQAPPKLHKWRAVKYANIHCRFSQEDVGNISVSDTPGLGDFISGAEERLAEMVGRDLDAALFVRMPSPHGPIVSPPDTNLYTLISKAITELTPKDWTYYIINKTAENAGNLDHFEADLQDKRIHTRTRHRVDCSNTGETLTALDEILSDIASNLGTLDQRLFKLRMDRLGELKTEILSLAERATRVLPKAGKLQPDEALFDKLFDEAWLNLGLKSKQQVDVLREKRNLDEPRFLAALEEVFSTLEKGPDLPDEQEVNRQSAAQGLMHWHAHKMNELRAEIARAFQSIDKVLQALFDEMRENALDALHAEDGGKLARLSNGDDPWEALKRSWEGLEQGDTMIEAIDMLLTSGLSFRGFIQPRVRTSLDVLDPDMPESKHYHHSSADKPIDSIEKLELAWRSAVSSCEGVIKEMAAEPSMALFAAAADFRGAILHTRGDRARDAWKLFYRQNRADVWEEEFTQLEADSRRRREWENAVKQLQASASVF